MTSNTTQEHRTKDQKDQPDGGQATTGRAGDGSGADDRLEKRRTQLRMALERVEEARRDLNAAEAELAAVRETRRTAKERLRETEELVDRLRREVKDSGKRRDKLSERVDRAAKELREREEKAREREQKYDRAVLAEMVAREKQRDLATDDTSTSDDTKATEDAKNTGKKATDGATGASEDTSPRVTEQDKPDEKVTVTDVDNGTTATRRTGTRSTTRTTRTSAARGGTARGSRNTPRPASDDRQDA